jgi:hypothetical protein
MLLHHQSSALLTVLGNEPCDDARHLLAGHLLARHQHRVQSTSVAGHKNTRFKKDLFRLGCRGTRSQIVLHLIAKPRGAVYSTKRIESAT